jgi:hypothetical protein
MGISVQHWCDATLYTEFRCANNIYYLSGLDAQENNKKGGVIGIWRNMTL